ncbi:HEAT repeat domain-containing protein [Actinomadura chokoriensis]|uniref:HEAT repeat domain-containing protein n=1 Tax=Actinomadura chokoriensis TaxID=454156 RepID=UPI0031F9884D
MLAGDPAVPVRPGLLELIGLLADEANTVSPSGVDDGWPDAWAAALPRVLSLLDDPDVAVRRVLASTLSSARADADAVVPALRARWDTEDDGAVRLGIIIATGELAGGCTAGVLPEALVWLRDLRRHDDAQIRMAAEMALATAVRAQRPDLGVLVAAVRGDISVWRDTPWVGDMPADLREFYGGRAARLLGWLGHRLEDDTAACTELAAAFIGTRPRDAPARRARRGRRRPARRPSGRRRAPVPARGRPDRRPRRLGPGPPERPPLPSAPSRSPCRKPAVRG